MKDHLKPTDDCEDFMNPATSCLMCRCMQGTSFPTVQCTASAYAAYGPPSFPVCSAAGALQYSTVQYSTAAGACSGLARTRGWLAAGGGARRSAPPGARSLAVVLATHRGADITYR